MKAQFLLSTLTEFPTLKDPKGNLLPEIALAGKSNVGKSSLINHLLNNKKVAKTSATPGKTQLLNFFLIDEKFLLVDLPGYGFAKAPPEEVKKWSLAIDTYLNTRPTLRLLLLLVDCRRGYSEEDLYLVNWAKKKQMPLLLIFTKTDKLSTSELHKLKVEHPEAIAYSVMNNTARHLVEKRINLALWD
jgi:GTP-binding protein